MVRTRAEFWTTRIKSETYFVGMPWIVEADIEALGFVIFEQVGEILYLQTTYCKVRLCWTR